MAPQDRFRVKKLAPEMQQVLSELHRLGALPLPQLSVQRARAQPGPADAANSLEIASGINRSPELSLRSHDVFVPVSGDRIPLRIYSPANGVGPYPVVLYFHSGGFVIGSIDVYDMTARRLALHGEVLVVAVDYRKAPEYPFPAAHEDAWHAYLWLIDRASGFGGDPRRIILMGESAGGNLAANVALRAAAEKASMPVSQILVYPLAGGSLDTPSYHANAESVPLGKATMEWFFRHAFADPSAMRDPRINLVEYPLQDLSHIPPALIITADLDPLRSEGQMYREHLRKAGVPVNALNIEGLAHEFFCMNALVPGARFAMQSVVAAIRQQLQAITSK
ncbi:acetyl esterase/lipase [Rhizobium sp. BK529]|uniref:alpha/beta hydrolase n=1 Tax=Rhizobium sp. BK529 TaxID=2586983 RepID=UPI0016117E9E|nr:alpha/beta hydrolase [Rhizobium sp. BK529]MBB3595163.1 acetyl esterase/lipase [Rhizobium sp. BK529]